MIPIPTTMTLEEAAADFAASCELFPGPPNTTCPGCHEPMIPGTIVCHLCGFRMTAEMFAGGAAFHREYRAKHPLPAPPPDVDPPKAGSQLPGLDDVIGNADAVLQIRTALDAHNVRRGRAKAEKAKPPAFPHVLLSGPGGTGKTMLSEIVARELGARIHLQMGQTLSNPAKIGEVLQTMRRGDVLFIDEIHGLKTQCQEALYRAMEDGVLVPVTRAGQPAAPPIRLPPFTIIGATTDEWALLPSMVQRFKYRVRLTRLTAEELSAAIAGRAKRMGLTITEDALAAIGGRALGTPRLAVGLLDGCVDTATAQGETEIDADTVRLTCQIWGIDSLGLDKVARAYLRVLAERKGEPVRLNVLATKLDGLSRRTVETKVEPDLVWLGLITKDADGRRLLDAGREHLNKESKR